MKRYGGLVSRKARARDHATETTSALNDKRSCAQPLPPDIQRDLRLDDMYEELSDLEALEHFQQLRREADERAW